jgi:ketosteroid isomerase-like protein
MPVQRVMMYIMATTEPRRSTQADPLDADPAAVAARFNGCINRRDVDSLAELMSDDHRFIDSEANTVTGKQACLDAWRGFFDSFPDYRNVFTSLTARNDVVSIVGYSECAEPSLAGPAIWTATIQGETVTEWRVYTDTPDTRTTLGIPDTT